MMGDDERGERPRRSWREIDQMRDRPSQGRDERPRSPRSEARTRAAAQQYVRKLDKMFSSAKGGAEGERLAKAVRDAHGTPELLEACTAYRDALGLPSAPSLLSIFLDAGDPEFVCQILEAITAGREEGEIEVTKGMRTQLRLLAEDANDEVADAAEELLAQL